MLREGCILSPLGRATYRGRTGCKPRLRLALHSDLPVCAQQPGLPDGVDHTEYVPRLELPLLLSSREASHFGKVHLAEPFRLLESLILQQNIMI